MAHAPPGPGPHQRQKIRAKADAAVATLVWRAELRHGHIHTWHATQIANDARVVQRQHVGATLAHARARRRRHEEGCLAHAGVKPQVVGAPDTRKMNADDVNVAGPLGLGAKLVKQQL